MYKLLGGLKEYFKLQEVQTDSAIFRLHNLFTTALLLACSLIITATQYVGSPISCIVNGVPQHVVNTFCWISSTFTMPDAFQRHLKVGVSVAHPGITNDFNDEDAKKYYTYYQWVCFVLFFQAIACYTPKFLWDAFEGGLLRMIVMGLNLGICREDEKRAKKEVIIGYLTGHLKRHKLYAIRYWCCEFLCLINIILQMWMMDRFFDGEFFSYGWRVMNFSDTPQEQRYDPMVYVFPRITKCIFHKYGASGSIQKHDSLCVLPLNIVNEKTYIFIWFWFIILLFLLIGLIIYRILMFSMISFRAKLLSTRNRMVPHNVARQIASKLDIGDWWLVYMLSRNLDPIIFKDVLEQLLQRLDMRSSHSRDEKS